MTSEHDDFWGGSADWPTAQNPIHSDAADVTGSTPRTRITGRHRFSGFLDRGAAPTREHRAVDRAQAPGGHEASDYAYGDDGERFDWDFADDAEPAAAFEATRATRPQRTTRTTRTTDAADVSETPEWGDEWDVAEPRSRAAMIDPLLARLGAVVVAITLAVPLVLSLRSGSDAADAVSQAESPVPPAVAEGPDVTMPAPTAVAESGAVATPTPESVESATAGAGSAVAAADPSTTASAAPAASATSAASTDSASTAAPAAPACGLEYEVVQGDFWLRLADGAGVSLDDLLAANGATSGTALYPGATICLPAGASTPPPPPVTTAAPATAAPATAAPTTAAPTTAAPTTAAPTTAAPSTAAPTTDAPTTAAPDPSPPAATGSVEEIIRAVWPDELEEKALDIAWRESNHQPDVRNYCCIGLFQIYWEVHRGWLSDMGITTADDLYDAEANARAAYRLYQRAGGWGPWGG